MKNYCEDKGGYLACITTDAENNFLYDYISSCGIRDVYFGLREETKNNWSWVSGEELEYINWGEGEPNNLGGNEAYGQFHHNHANGKWNDGYGEESVGYYLCEWDEINTNDYYFKIQEYENELNVGDYISITIELYLNNEKVNNTGVNANEIYLLFQNSNADIINVELKNGSGKFEVNGTTEIKITGIKRGDAELTLMLSNGYSQKISVNVMHSFIEPYTWKFSNSKKDFEKNWFNDGYYISGNDFERLMSDFSNPIDAINMLVDVDKGILRYNVEADYENSIIGALKAIYELGSDGFEIFQRWSGSCQGMSAWTVLAKQNIRSAKDIEVVYEDIYDVKMSDVTESAINFYHNQQYLASWINSDNEFAGLNRKDRIRQLELCASLAEKEKKAFMITYYWCKQFDENGKPINNSVSGHAVVGYGIEEGNSWVGYNL